MGKFFNCPKCGDYSPVNYFGDITVSAVAQKHPFISLLGHRVCRNSYHGALRFETLSKSEMEKYIID